MISSSREWPCPRSSGIGIGVFFNNLPQKVRPIALPDVPKHFPEPGRARGTRRLLIQRARLVELGNRQLLPPTQLRTQISPDVEDAFAVLDPLGTAPIDAALLPLAIGQRFLVHKRHAGNAGVSPL